MYAPDTDPTATKFVHVEPVQRSTVRLVTITVRLVQVSEVIPLAGDVARRLFGASSGSWTVIAPDVDLMVPMLSVTVRVM